METKNWEVGINPFMVLDPKWAGHAPSSTTHLEITVLVVVIVPYNRSSDNMFWAVPAYLAG
jgi:hypothetical protein